MWPSWTRAVTTLFMLAGCGPAIPKNYVQNHYEVWVPRQDEQLFDAMFAMLFSIGPDYGAAQPRLSESVKGWAVIWESSNEEGVFRYDGDDVYGYTACTFKEVHLGRPAAKYMGVCGSAFYHEFMHVYENCEPGHKDWEAKGFLKGEAQFSFQCWGNGYDK